MGIHTIVYPMSQLLTSAEKILQAGTDIRTGWLGVFLDDASSKEGLGVAIRNVLQDSPAQRAGLAAGDVLLRWNQVPLQHVRQFIRMVQETPAGTRVDLDILRQGERQTLSATIDSRKPEDTRRKIHCQCSGTGRSGGKSSSNPALLKTRAQTSLATRGSESRSSL